MIDDDLLTIVREQRSKVRMTTPVEQVIGRGQAGQPAAGAAALAVTALLPAGHQAGRPLPAQLAAWTVTQRAGGTIYVTVRQLRDAAGLQRRLRADGVPASVTFFGREPRACQPYPADRAVVGKVFGGHGPPLVIHPAALPSGAGVQLNPGHYAPGAPIALAFGLVRASSGCTGP